MNPLETTVRKFGMPTFFATFTADEARSTREPGVGALESISSSAAGEFRHGELPVVMVRLFDHRLENLKKHMLLDGPRILGRIQEHVICIEFSAEDLHMRTACSGYTRTILTESQIRSYL